MIKRPSIKRYIPHLLASLLCAPLFQSAAQAAKLYKWVDEEGKIRYSDRLTIEESKKRHQILTPDGRVIDTKEQQKTPEQIRTERAEAEKQKELARIEAEKQARIQAEKDHHDQVLMMTFTSEEEILEAQKERIDVIDSVINLLNRSIASEKEKLEQLELRAKTEYLDKAKRVPGGLAQNIEYFNEKLLNKQKQLELKVEEKNRIKEQYVNDLLRFRELSRLKTNEAQ